jgi:hypothetical protein
VVEVIVKGIGEQVKANNSYFQNFAVNAIQMPNGQIVVNPYGDEPEVSGIDDCQGIAFYIRIEPKATVRRDAKKFSSCDYNYRATQKCHLVAFAFEHPKEIDSEKWVDTLAFSLLNLNRNVLPANPVILVTEKNASHIDAFTEETKKKFNVVKKFNCVKVSFDLEYDVSVEDCKDLCNIFKDC